jgi:ferredoxin-NADP reductase
VITQPLIRWQTGTVEKIVRETPTVKSFTMTLPEWQPFRAGQHFDVRLTAPDGYQAQRSYSIASPPEQRGSVEITVELLEDGEVSPYFHEVVQEGDQIEMRGPIGGPFTWTTKMGGPILLLGGGSGVVPLMSMLRHRHTAGATDIPAELLYSARSLDEVIYAKELEQMATEDQKFHLALTLTRRQPPGWQGFARRVDSEMLKETIDRLGTPKLAYVCGPSGFVESVAWRLVELGLPPANVRTERFGPTGT